MKKRSILLSMLVIGVVAALIAAATSATFTDQVTSNNNTFAAGTLYMTVDNACDVGTVTGDRAGQYGVGGAGGADVSGNTTPCDIGTTAISATNMYPGQTASHDYSVVNKGSLSGDLTVTAGTITIDANHPNCASTNFTVTTSTGSTKLIASGSTTSTVQVEMVSTAGNACQGATATISLTFDLAQSATQP